MNLLFEPSTVLVTGGAGFIGSNFIRWLLANVLNVNVINLDVLTYAGNLENLTDVQARHSSAGDGRYYFLRADIRDLDTVCAALRGDHRETVSSGRGRAVPKVDAIVHFAAESHVDRSIMGPGVFVDTNVRGTLTLLEATRMELDRERRPFRFLHVSTDEVYGSLGPDDPTFTEAHPLAPNSPYSASKAGSDCLVRAYGETFQLPVLTTRCSNNYGPFQFPEKLIPLMITRALRDEPLPVFGDGRNVRDWLYVEDHAEALWAVLQRAKTRSVYNIGGESEVTNIDLVRRLLNELAKPESLITFVRDRMGHDRRYAMNIGAMQRDFGWQPRHSLATGLALTIGWYLSHRGWWERVIAESYRATTALYLPQGADCSEASTEMR